MVRMMGTFDDWQAQKDSQYILAVDYLEQLAKQHDSTIEATANYLIHCDSLKDIYEKSDNGEYYPAYEPTGYGYYDNDTPPPRIQFLESAKANTDTTGKILSKDFYRMWDNHYFKKSELPAIEPVAPSEVQTDKVSPLNSLASFVTSYNLPQVTALILGISFEHIYITRQAAQIDENEFSYDIVIKFDKLLQSLIATAESGNLQGFNITYFEQNNPFYLYNSYGDNPQYPTIKKFDYLNSVIDKASLETYLKSIGKDLRQLLELQEPLTMPIPQTDSQLSQQVVDLNAQLAKADDTIDRQAKEIAQLKNDYEALKQGYGFLETTNKALIEQAGKDTQSDTPADNDLFAKILDESNENHAIDLKYAINLWLDLYVINPRAHGEHSGNADTWLKKNTGYSELKGGDGSIKRIREIATPLKKFGSTRPKENQK